eukprot:5113984-Pyramimonas_sp.AAC.1
MAEKYREAIRIKSQPEAPTALSRDELRSMVTMAERSGDKATAAKYKQLLEQADKGSEDKKPAQLRANKAHARLRKTKGKLEAENAVLANLLEQVETQKALVSELVSELDSAENEYRVAVAEVAAGVSGQAPAKVEPIKLSLAKLMDGELDDIDLEDDGLFGYTEFEELGPAALEEAKSRKKQMLESFKQMAGSFFGEVRQKGQALQAEHK